MNLETGTPAISFDSTQIVDRKYASIILTVYNQWWHKRQFQKLISESKSGFRTLKGAWTLTYVCWKSNNLIQLYPMIEQK